MKNIEYTTPENVGISSENILKLIKTFNNSGLNMHDVIIARHGKICYEAYWKPFHKDFAHRIYSSTKTFVAIAVGFLEQDGLIDINERILTYFPDEANCPGDEKLAKQTVKDMLIMSTVRCEYDKYWLKTRPADRVKNYFEVPPIQSKNPGTIFFYDSEASFILCAMVERISGKTLLEYLREKVFGKIGMSDNISCLTCPGGHSWGDSALIMPAQDFLKFAMFLLNYGAYNGEQILNRKFVIDATSKQIDNNFSGDNTYNNQGYGYQIWRTYDNSFSMNGMGCQFAICVPDKDLIFICNSDNQGIDYAGKLIFDSFFEHISRTASNVKIAEDLKYTNELKNYTDALFLSVAKGGLSSKFACEIDGKTFKLAKNRMGITEFSLTFNSDGGSFKYINAQGDKELRFGMCKNVFQDFPQTGYSDECGTVEAPGNMYKCAVSAAWLVEKKLHIKVQIIDKYFGQLNIIIGFNDKGCSVIMKKAAEDFLDEYDGYAFEK